MKRIVVAFLFEIENEIFLLWILEKILIYNPKF